LPLEQASVHVLRTWRRLWATSMRRLGSCVAGSTTAFFRNEVPLSSEPNGEPSTKLVTEKARVDGSDPSNTARSGDSQPWGRPDRIRLLIWAGIAFLLPVPLLLALHLQVIPTGSVLTVQTEFQAKAIAVCFVVLATWIVSRIEKRPLDDYGIPPRQVFGRRFWEGSVWGFAMLSVIPLVLGVSGNFRIDSIALTGGAVFRYALGWAAVFLALSIAEEFAFRGYWLFSLSRRMRFWPAAFFLSAVFAAAHLTNSQETALGIAEVVATGLLFCLTIRRTGNLWFAVGFHAAWDWAETFFYGAPDSGLLGVGRFLNTSVRGPSWLTGGSAGPEGSVIAFFVLLFCALLVHLRFPRAIYPDRPV
jgi:membrane protease YdiL (CAAX protease family)